MISQSSRISFSTWAFALRPRRSDKEPASGLKRAGSLNQKISSILTRPRRFINQSSQLINYKLKDFPRKLNPSPRVIFAVEENGRNRVKSLQDLTHLPYSSLENFGFSMFKPDVNGFLLCLSLCLLAYWLNMATLAPKDSFGKTR